MTEMVPTVVLVIVVGLVVLFATLAVTQPALANIFEKKEKIEEEAEKVSERIASIVVVSGEPFVNLESCSKDPKKTEFTYKFVVSGLDVSFQGLPGRNDKLDVFATLFFKKGVARDRENKVITLEQGKIGSFGVLEFEIKGSGAPFVLRPDDAGFQGVSLPRQSIVVNNYSITPLRQFQPLGIPIANCVTDFLVACKQESDKVSLTSCKDDPFTCSRTVVLCGGRVDITLESYHSGNCGSRPMSLLIQADKKTEGWNYFDSAVINFWKREAAEPRIVGLDVEEPCWQRPEILTEECKEKFLGSEIFNFPKEKYNVAGCSKII